MGDENNLTTTVRLNLVKPMPHMALARNYAIAAYWRLRIMLHVVKTGRIHSALGYGCAISGALHTAVVICVSPQLPETIHSGRIAQEA